MFENIQQHDCPESWAKRLSMDCKATVKLGAFSRGGKTRGDCQALEHDFSCGDNSIPFGIVDEETGQMFLRFTNSAKTSDLMVDSLEDWRVCLSSAERATIEILQITADNGSESSERWTQFLNRLVAFAVESVNPFICCTIRHRQPH